MTRHLFSGCKTGSPGCLISVLLALLIGTLLAGCGIIPDHVVDQPPAVPLLPLLEPATGLFATETPLPRPTSTVTPLPVPTSTPIPFEEVPAAISYVLPLTTRHVTPTEAILLFELDAPTAGVLIYQPVDQASAQVALPLDAAQVRHQIRLTGLLPGVTYRADVGIASETGLYRRPAYQGGLWGDVTFRTPDGREPLRVGVLGDSGFGDNVTAELVAEMTGYNLDFVLHTGDVVYQVYNNASPLEAFALKYYLPFAPLLRRMPIYTVAGNHDVEAATYWQGLPFYYYAFPPFEAAPFPSSDFGGWNKWYAFSYDDLQFLMLDTQALFGEPGDEAQDAWLAERLAEPGFARTIAVFHVPPYSSGRHGGSDSYVVRYRWAEMLETAGVPLVLSGHDHDYERLAAGGTTYVVSGGGSATLYALAASIPESQVFQRRAHFVLLEIYRDRIDLQAIAPGGEVLDQHTIPSG